MFDVGSFTFSFTFFYVRLLSFTNVSAGGLRRRVCLRLFTFVYFRLPNSVSKRHPLPLFTIYILLFHFLRFFFNTVFDTVFAV